jgi:hypothetical protein
MLCKYCDGLTVEALCELAQIQLSKHDDHQYEFSQDAYYCHQPSYDGLINSAKGGCDLCAFIWQGFRDFEMKMAPILGSTAYILDVETEIYKRRNQGLPTDIRVCIDSSYHFGDDDPKTNMLFDALLIQAGDEDEFILPLKFRLSAPRGKEVQVRPGNLLTSAHRASENSKHISDWS